MENDIARGIDLWWYDSGQIDKKIILKVLLLDSLFLEQFEKSGYDAVKRALSVVSAVDYPNWK